MNLLNYNLNKILALDEKKLKAICDNDSIFCDTLLNSAIASFNEEKKILLSLYTLDDIEALIFVIHKIKSTSSAIYGLKVFEIASEINITLKYKKKISTKDLDFLLLEIDVLINRLFKFSL